MICLQPARKLLQFEEPLVMLRVFPLTQEMHCPEESIVRQLLTAEHVFCPLDELSTSTLVVPLQARQPMIESVCVHVQLPWVMMAIIISVTKLLIVFPPIFMLLLSYSNLIYKTDNSLSVIIEWVLLNWGILIYRRGIAEPVVLPALQTPRESWRLCPQCVFAGWEPRRKSSWQRRRSWRSIVAIQWELYKAVMPECSKTVNIHRGRRSD